MFRGISILIILLVLLSENVNTYADKEIELKAARYLKNCGFLTLLKTTKCIMKSSSIEKELRKLSKKDSQDLSRLRNICQETTECIKNLNCEQVEKDNEDVINFCWRANFSENFRECETKLIELKKNEKIECLNGYKENKNITSTKELCLFLRNSKDCMKLHVNNLCGAEKYEEWEKMARDQYSSSECLKMIGLQLDG